jgi:hypothetical protein
VVPGVGRDRNPDTRRSLVGLTAWFVLTRLGYALTGVRFDASLIDMGFQFIDPTLLRRTPLESLYYLHAQPPILNFVTALALRSPLGTAVSLRLLFLGVGLVATLVMFLLLRELAVATLPALIVTGCFMATPTVVLYENWYYATYLVFAGLLLAGWCAARFFRRGTLASLAGAMSALAGVALTRSTYHLVVVAVLGLLVVVLGPRSRRRVALLGLALALVVVGGWYVKNWVEFGAPTASTWFGMNLANIALHNQPPGRVAGEVRAGRLGHLAEIPPFSPLPAYRGRRPDPTGVAVLDRARKQGSRWPNYNNIAYIGISDRYGVEAVRFIRRHPDWYLEMVGASFRYAFTGTATYPFVTRNAVTVAPALTAEERLLGQSTGRSRLLLPTAGSAPAAGQIEWVLVAAYALALIAALTDAAVAVWRRRTPKQPRATVIFLGAMVAAGLLANFADLGENMRFRFETDGLVVVITAAVVGSGIRLLRKRREPARDCVTGGRSEAGAR